MSDVKYAPLPEGDSEKGGDSYDSVSGEGDYRFAHEQDSNFVIRYLRDLVDYGCNTLTRVRRNAGKATITTATVLLLAIVVLTGLSTLPQIQTILSEAPNDTLLTYIFNDNSLGHHRTNFEFFLRHGLHSNIDIIFVIQGETSVVIPDEILQRPNIEVRYMPNECYDIGRHGQILNSPEAAKYKKFIMMNASVRGPFMPAWSDQCWSDVFLDKVTDRVKLVGTTVNCLGLDLKRNPHLQSMLLATDRTGLDILRPLQTCKTQYTDAVGAEVASASSIIKAGYEVDVVSYRVKGKYHRNMTDAWEHCEWDDPNGGKGIDGFTPDPFDYIFPKYHEKSDHAFLDQMSEYLDGYEYRAEDYCGKGRRRR